jgi:hypothetical protein
MPRQPRLLTMFVLSCALFLRVAVPAGWMPSTSGGAFAIEPCVAAAPAMAGHEGSHHGSTGKAQHAGECSFAPFQAGFAANAHLAALPVPAPVDAALPQQHPAERPFARGPPAPPPPATGPPAIA